MATPLAGTRLYAILDHDQLLARRLTPESVLEMWLDAGVRLIQLRAKTLSGGPMLRLADRLMAQAGRAGASLVVNDRADVARLSGATGLHVGQTDLSPPDARSIVGDAAMLGLSTHDLAQVREAVRQPIDYLAIGPVYATTTKHEPDPVVGLAGVRAAAAIARRAGLPLVAIGGITEETAPEVVAAGADTVAVTAALLDGDVGLRARELLRALT